MLSRHVTTFGVTCASTYGHEIASDFSVRFPISHMGISAATFKAAEPMVRKKAFGMKTPYS